jgi:hypothetical protein
MIGVLVATLVPASAFAVDLPTPPPASAPAVAAPQAAAAKPAAKPAPAPASVPAAEPLPGPAVRLWMVASAPQGPWTMRIDNEGDKPLRIPADVRMLRFEIEPEPYVAPIEAGDAKPKKAVKPKAPAKPTVCKIPAPLRADGFPEKSALLLRPGESYVESFDPRLFCFGKDAAARLVGGAVVHTRFGWEAPKKPAWSPAKKKPDTGPFAVEGTAFPPEVMPLRELTAPTMVLRFNPAAKRPAPESRPEEPPADASEPQSQAADTKAADAKATDTREPQPRAADAKATDAREPQPSAADAKAAAPLPPVVDENAPRLDLTSAPFIEASSTTRATITITATNVGRRPMLVALHPRMLGFRIDGPDGVLRCSPMPPTHGIPRERFRTLAPGASSAMTQLLGEGCPRDAMRRPGLYRIQTTLLAGESGSELGLAAYTGTAQAREPTLLRVLDGPDPFYAVAPRAVPTPKPPAPPEGEGDE